MLLLLLLPVILPVVLLLRVLGVLRLGLGRSILLLTVILRFLTAPSLLFVAVMTVVLIVLLLLGLFGLFHVLLILVVLVTLLPVALLLRVLGVLWLLSVMFLTAVVLAILPFLRRLRPLLLSVFVVLRLILRLILGVLRVLVLRGIAVSMAFTTAFSSAVFPCALLLSVFNFVHVYTYSLTLFKLEKQPFGVFVNLRLEFVFVHFFDLCQLSYDMRYVHRLVGKTPTKRLGSEIRAVRFR